MVTLGLSMGSKYMVLIFNRGGDGRDDGTLTAHDNRRRWDIQYGLHKRKEKQAN